MKRCTHCNLIKNNKAFSKNKQHQDGLQSWCKKCEEEYMRSYIQSGQYKKSKDKHDSSDAGKRAKRINLAKYNNLGYNEICKNPYPKIIKIAYHHINNNDVIPIPSEIHDRFSGNGITLQRHRKFILNWITKHYPIKLL